MAVRDDFAGYVKQALALRVGSHCSRPDCQALTSGPHQLHTDKAVNLGVAAHITAAAAGGPRFDAKLAAAERASIRNAIWLCQNCAKLIDSDTARFTVAVLRDWKFRAETSAETRLGKTAAALANEMSSLRPVVRTGQASLIVLGPGVVAEGQRVAVSQDLWELRIDRFLLGDDAALSRVGDYKSTVPPDEHFVVLNNPDDARTITGTVRWTNRGDHYDVHVPVASPWLTRTVRDRESLDIETMRDVKGVRAGATTLQCWLGQGVGHFGDDDRVGCWLPKWWHVASLVERRDELIRMEIVRLAGVPRLMNEYTGEIFAPLDFVERVVSVSVLPIDRVGMQIMAKVEVIMSGENDPWSDSIVLATELPESIEDIMAALLRQLEGA